MSAEPDRPDKGPWEIVKRVAAVLAVCALLAWVIWRAWHDAAKIDWRALDIRYGLFALSMALYGLGFVWHGYVWVRMMRMLGYDLAALPGVKAAAASQLGNYIPGKVFIVIFRARIARKHGIPGVPVAGSIALETVLRNMMATMLVALGLYRVGANISYMWGLAILIIGAAIFAQPRVFHAIGDWALRKLDRLPLPDRLTGPQVASLLGCYFIYWANQCFAFFLMVRATFGVDFSALPLLATALVGAQIGSTLAVFAPVGLGAAEATMAGLLQLTGAVSAPYVVALLMRVWRTAAEMIEIGIIWLIPDADEEDTPEETSVADADIAGPTNEPPSGVE